MEPFAKVFSFFRFEMQIQSRERLIISKRKKKINRTSDEKTLICLFGLTDNEDASKEPGKQSDKIW